MKVKELEVWVTDSQNERLNEFQPTIEGSTAVCYLESKVGQEFIIHFSDNRNVRPNGMSFQSYIDGSKVDSMFLRLNDPKAQHAAGLRVGADQIRPFMFAKPTLVDANTQGICQDANILNQLATIEVKCFRGVPNAVYNTPPAKMHANTFDGLKFSEQSKKGNLTSITQLGSAKKVAPTGTVNVDWIDALEGSPFCHFKFRYMTRDMLEARDIAPITKAPTPIPTPEDNAQKRRRADDELARLRAENERLRKKVKVEGNTASSSTTINLEDDEVDVKPKIIPKVEHKMSRDSKGRMVIELD